MVVVKRQETRQRRILKVAWILVPFVVYFWHRILIGNPIELGMPRLTQSELQNLPIFFIVAALVFIVIIPVAVAGRSIPPP